MSNRKKQDLYNKIHDKKNYTDQGSDRMQRLIELEEELDEVELDSEEEYEEFFDKVLRV